jgi:tetratricopeptide (TPR) repeat protein
MGPSMPTFDVFLSHSSVDKPWAIQLKDALQRYGVSVWLDRDEIRPGDLFVKALEAGLEQSRAVALIVSPEAVASGWVEEEYARAMFLAQNKQRALRLIPVLLRDATLPGFLQNRHQVDFRDERAYAQKVWELAWGITGQKPPEILDLTALAASPARSGQPAAPSEPMAPHALWVRILRGLQQYRLRKLLLLLSTVALVSLVLYVLFPYVYVIRAHTLLQKARHEEDIKQAGEAYQTAVENMRWVFWDSQRAVLLNRLGRLYAARRFGRYALHFYSEAIRENPNLAEAYANKAFLLEESGEQEAYLSEQTTKFEEALALYKQALQKDPDDHFTRALHDGVQRRQQTALHRAQVEELLSIPHKCRETKSVEDAWTSTPLTLTFHLATPRQHAFAQRAGEGEVLLQRLAQKFRESRRVMVQDSAITDDCFAVRLIAVYRIMRSATDFLHRGELHVRLLETDTASSQAEAQVEWTNGVLDGVAEQLASNLLQHLHHTYQLQGRIVSVTPQDIVMLNIGADQGVTSGLTMRVLGPAGPVGVIEVTHVEKQQSQARIVEKTGTVGFQKDWQVQEVLKP